MACGGRDWEKRTDWAAQVGMQGVDVDPELLARARVQLNPPIPFQEMIGFISQGRFSPVVPRPLFNQLGIVTNRMFATFSADTIPLLMLPRNMVESIYGASACVLCIDHAVK